MLEQVACCSTPFECVFELVLMCVLWLRQLPILERALCAGYQRLCALTPPLTSASILPVTCVTHSSSDSIQTVDCDQPLLQKCG
jgi:hypothetical protein